MERHRADLEGEARKGEDDAEQLALRQAVAHRLGNAREAGRPGKPVEQRDAVEQDAARQRAENEIFEAGLRRAGVGPLETGEDIGREALHLEPDIERQQVGRRGHHAHADRREQDQHRIFGAVIALAPEPARRREQRHGGRDVDHDLGKGCEAVGREHAGEGGGALIGDAGHHAHRRDQRNDGEPGQELRRAITGPGSHEHQGEADRAQQLFGENQQEIVLQHQCVPSPSCAAAGAGAWPGVSCASPRGAARSIRWTRAVTSARIGARKLSG